MTRDVTRCTRLRLIEEERIGFIQYHVLCHFIVSNACHRHNILSAYSRINLRCSGLRGDDARASSTKILEKNNVSPSP